MEQTKIIVADDHSILQDGLCSILEMEKSFKVVGRAASGRSAIELAARLSPDLVIMDVSMPELNGIEATKQILETNNQIKVIGLSMHIEKVYVTGMISAGASGYILKTCSFKELLKGIKTVISGEYYFCKEIKPLLVVKDGEIVKKNKSHSFSVLSMREREVLQLIAEGYISKEIAQKLKISPKTVDIHRKNVKTKLNIDSIAGLTKYAISEGLTSSIL
jgi:DNA-binding NarL/FixJ family response regulator